MADFSSPDRSRALVPHWPIRPPWPWLPIDSQMIMNDKGPSVFRLLLSHLDRWLHRRLGDFYFNILVMRLHLFSSHFAAWLMRFLSGEFFWKKFGSWFLKEWLPKNTMKTIKQGTINQLELLCIVCYATHILPLLLGRWLVSELNFDPLKKLKL